jgi:hypothetical protein
MDGIFTHIYREHSYDNIDNDWWCDSLSDDELELPIQNTHHHHHHQHHQQQHVNNNNSNASNRLATATDTATTNDVTTTGGGSMSTINPTTLALNGTIRPYSHVHSRTRSLASFTTLSHSDPSTVSTTTTTTTSSTTVATNPAQQTSSFTMSSTLIPSSIASLNALQSSIKDDENSLLAMALLLSNDAQENEWRELGLSDLALS